MSEKDKETKDTSKETSKEDTIKVSNDPVQVNEYLRKLTGDNSIGKCSRCGFDCNSLAQLCGQCIRQMNHC